ncbi:MAG: GGDEF domain-containing protein [Acidimicrobiales bacterium]
MVDEMVGLGSPRRGLGRGLSALLPTRLEPEVRPALDALTGLPGHDEFVQRIESTLHQARKDDTALAVIALGLNGFRRVNRVYGHHIGDALLKAVASRLASRRRAHDLVARLGGDEFGVFCHKVRDLDNAAHLVRRLQREVEEPFTVDGTVHHLNATAGVAWMHTTTDDGAARELVRHADLAMHHAKDELMPWALFDDAARAPSTGLL